MKKKPQPKKSEIAGEISFEHCLRPVFTHSIYKILREKRKSLNLIAPGGSGKSRLVEDLFECNLPQDTKIIQINLSDFKKDYQGFENSVKIQLGIPTEEKITFDRAVDVYLEKNVNIYILFILDNFDSICENHEKHISYNRAFAGNLNALKNGGKVSLLCISKKSIKTSTMYIQEEVEAQGQKISKTIAFDSPLDLDIKEINKLSEEEIETELFRSDEKVKEFLSKDLNTKKEIILYVQNYKYYYSLLEQCKDKLPFELELVRKDLKKWKKETISSLEQKYVPSIDKRIRNWDLTVKTWLDRTVRVVKSNFTFIKIVMIWGKVIKWSIVIAIPLAAYFYKKIAEWIGLLFP